MRFVMRHCLVRYYHYLFRRSSVARSRPPITHLSAADRYAIKDDAATTTTATANDEQPTADGDVAIYAAKSTAATNGISTATAIG